MYFVSISGFTLAWVCACVCLYFGPWVNCTPDCVSVSRMAIRQNGESLEIPGIRETSRASAVTMAKAASGTRVSDCILITGRIPFFIRQDPCLHQPRDWHMEQHEVYSYTLYLCIFMYINAFFMFLHVYLSYLFMYIYDLKMCRIIERMK